MSWTERIAGLQVLTTGSVSQLAFEDLIWDPFWFTSSRHNTNNPEQVILHGCGQGFLAVSQNAAKNWEDRTGYLELNGPPNSWGDSPAPVMNQVIINQIHGDIHKLGRFCGIAQLATGTATASRGWLLVTDNDWFDTEWHGMSSLNWDGTYLYANRVCAGCVTQGGKAWRYFNVANALGGPDDKTMYFEKQAGDCSGQNALGGGTQTIVFDFGFQAVLTDVAVKNKGTQTATAQDVRFASEGSGYDADICSFDVTTRDGTLTSWYHADSSLTWYELGDTNNPRRYMQLRLNITAGDADGAKAEIDSVRTTAVPTLTPVLPLALDVDNETGKQCYVTAWEDGDLVLQNWNVTTTTPIFSSKYTIATVTISEIEQKSTFAVPFCLADINVSSYGDVVFLFGYFGGKHIIQSTDAGATFGSNLGSGAWGTDRVSAFIAVDNTTWYAWLKTATSQSDMWRTTDGGTSWVKIQSALPVAPEHECISRHPAGNLLVGNSDVGPVQAIELVGDYSGQYVDRTGPSAGSRLPGAGDGGGGLSSIVWIA